MIEQILQADRLMQVDQVAKARDIYQRVVELDPGNAIAVVGLARCALADGDEQQAYELASKALTIDPENDMARRMEARLSEIFSTRGEPTKRPEAAATPGSQEMRPIVTDTAEDSPAAASPTRPTTTPPTDPSPTARPTMHKSLFDRLLGR